MTDVVKIFLVDDHRLFRDGLARLLASDKRFEVVGQMASGEEFLEAYQSFVHGVGADTGVVHEVAGITHEAGASGAKSVASGAREAKTVAGVMHGTNTPQAKSVVFMDIDMPGGMGGIEASRRALEQWPDAKIIALSMHGEPEYYLPMVEAGVKGFLLKNSDFAEVTAAAMTVAGGGTYFSQELMSSMVAALRYSGTPTLRHGSGAAGGGAFSERETLSEREAEVLPLVCKGLSNQQIADRLFISKRTVDKHRANILAKTGCHNTAGLVVYAVKNKLIEV